LPGDRAQWHVGMAASSPRRARKTRARARRSRILAPRASLASLLLAAGALAGCGGSVATSSSVGQKPQLTVSSPVLTAKGLLPAQYTCAGRNIVPPIKWGNVPANTAELALFLLDLGHTESSGGAVQAKLKVAWMIRGLKPTLTGMAEGKLPAEAIEGRGRYSICPPKGATGQYMFRLYALPRPVSIGRGLSDLEAFRQINRAGSAVGYFLSGYTRT
jgi:phosphatidylethanolamine-binding protein (PEBP) family uncharacterized protein